jgi:archaetidylinositol phosphate synthase
MAEERIMRNILASKERSILFWLCRRMPAQVTPDHLTWFGLFGTIIAFVSYLATWISPLFYLISSIGIIINWFGDSLDGSLARYRKIERPVFGFFFDQTIDLLGALFIAFGLGLSMGVRLDICLLALSGYFAVSCSTLIEYSITRKFFVSASLLGPTELRLMIVLFNISLLSFPKLLQFQLFYQFNVSDALVALLAFGLWWFYLKQFLINYRFFGRE